MHILSVLLTIIFLSIITGCTSDSIETLSPNQTQDPNPIIPNISQCDVVIDNNCHSIEVSWTASIDTQVFGYYVYHGTTTGQHSDRIWVKETTIIVINLNESGNHYFAVSAVNNAGESIKSYDTMITI